MLSLMTRVAEQFEVVPIKCDAWGVAVGRCYILLVMSDVTRTTATFADTMLRQEVCVAAFTPRFALIEPLGKLFYCDHLPIQKAPVQIEQMLFCKIGLNRNQIFLISSSLETMPRLLPQSQFTWIVPMSSTKETVPIAPGLSFV
jgi:hypothetical protein